MKCPSKGTLIHIKPLDYKACADNRNTRVDTSIYYVIYLKPKTVKHVSYAILD